jgi:hypothetical protein
LEIKGEIHDVDYDGEAAAGAEEVRGQDAAVCEEAWGNSCPGRKGNEYGFHGRWMIRIYLSPFRICKKMKTLIKIPKASK